MTSDRTASQGVTSQGFSAPLTAKNSNFAFFVPSWGIINHKKRQLKAAFFISPKPT
jgi:hypothetical protein